MVVELSKYMTPVEIDACVDFMHVLSNSVNDSNPSVTDCKTQIELLIGKERFLDVCKQWNKDNQKFLSVFGKMKYKCVKTGQLYDGLDPEDNPDDYEKTYV
jgi:hypothetical protein